MKNIIESIGVDNWISIIGFCVTIIAVFLTSYLTTKSNQKKMISESFKAEGIKVQERLLEFWSNLLCGTFENGCINYIKNSKISNKLKTEDIVNKILNESIVYSSKPTIKAIATYQQYTYNSVKNNSDSSKKKNNTFITMESLIVPLRVLKRMKYDFTGEKVSELDLLRIRLNDWDLLKALISYYYIIYYYVKERILYIAITVLLLLLFLII